VIFFSHIEVFSISDKHFTSQELSSASNDENSLCSESDTADEDQMDQSCMFSLTDQPKDQLFYISILPHFDDLFLSIWQPPKVF
jgi:hypothetical protein